MVAARFLISMFLIRHPNKKLIGQMDKTICKMRNVVPMCIAEYCVNGSTFEATEHTVMTNQLNVSTELDITIRRLNIDDTLTMVSIYDVQAADQIEIWDIMKEIRVAREDIKKLKVQAHKRALREAANEVLCVILDVNALQRLEEDHETSLSVKQSLKTLRDAYSHDSFFFVDDESHVAAAKSKLVLGILGSLTEEIKQRLKRKGVTNLEAILQVVRENLSHFSGSNVPEDIVEYTDSFFEHTLEVLNKNSTTELL